MYDWSDLHIFLRLLQEGSVNRAAASLGVSPSTVSRRLQGLEEALGAALFVRSSTGLLPTALAEEIEPMARQIQATATQVGSLARDHQGEPAGLVRVAATTELTELILLPALPELLERYPKLQVEVITHTELVDLTRREADLAVRTIKPTRGEGLVVRRLRQVQLAVFCSRGYLERHGDQRPPQEQRWVSWEQGRAHLSAVRWLEAAAPGVEPVFRGSSLMALRMAAACGLGLVLLPEIFGDLTPALVRYPWRGLPLPSGELWLVGHEALRRSARVCAVRDFLVELLSPREDDLALARSRLKGLQEGMMEWEG